MIGSTGSVVSLVVLVLVLCNLIASLALWLRRQPREQKILGSNPACAGIFKGLSHTSDLENWHSSGYPARRLAF